MANPAWLYDEIAAARVIAGIGPSRFTVRRPDSIIMAARRKLYSWREAEAIIHCGSMASALTAFLK